MLVGWVRWYSFRIFLLIDTTGVECRSSWGLKVFSHNRRFGTLTSGFLVSVGRVKRLLKNAMSDSWDCIVNVV